MWGRLPPVWKACAEEAWTALLEGSVPVGAAVADGDGRVVARGRNRIVERNPCRNQIAGHPLAHAEINALLQVNCHRSDYALYSTLEPCPLCLGAFYMSGIQRLYYAARDGNAGSTDLLGKTPYLTLKPVRVHGPCLELEALFQTLHLAFGVIASGGFRPQLMERFMKMYPRCGRLSRQLTREGFWTRAAEKGLSTREMVAALSPRLQPEILVGDQGLTPWELEG